MWKAWNNTAEEEDDSSPLFKRDLVLSWKQLNVTVVRKIPKIFGSSEVVTKQILNNGKLTKTRIQQYCLYCNLNQTFYICFDRHTFASKTIAIFI